MHIRIVSPAGSIKTRLIDDGARTLKSWGHKVTVAAHAKGSYGRFSSTPQERAQDLLDALEDKDVDVIWCSRGGYGCMQILDMIPLELISRAGKPIIGYSDITALHALWQHAGIRSIHAPMMKHLATESSHRTTQTLRELLEYYAAHRNWPPKHNLLFMKKARLFVAPHQGWSNEDLNPESTEELLDELLAHPVPFVGGNLAVLTGLHGTPYDFDYRDKILFIEDIAETPYKIDRMMQQLRLCGILNQVKGLICGSFTGCEEDPLMPVKMWDNFRMIVEPYGIPLWLGSPIGHEVNNWPVIEG